MRRADGPRIAAFGLVSRNSSGINLLLALSFATGSAAVAARADNDAKPSRKSLIQRADVWTQSDIKSKDLWRGPQESDGFLPGAEVRCEYDDKKLSGNSPKFECRLGTSDGKKNGKPDVVKVKYGGTNGEV